MAKSHGQAPEEEEPFVFFIPDNYTNSGGFFGGMFKLRNLIEAGIFGGLVFAFEFYIVNIDLVFKIILMLVTVTPITIAAVVGIRGDCLSQFILAVFDFLKSKRKMRYRRVDTYVEEEKGRSILKPRKR